VDYYSGIYFLALLKKADNNTPIAMSTPSTQISDSKCHLPIKGVRALWKRG